MSTKTSPGQRAHLRALGIDPARVGRTFNNAAVLPKDVPIPRNADELAEFMGDPGRFRPILASQEALTDFVRQYGELQAAKDPGIEAQVRAEVDKQFAAIMRQDQVENVHRLNLAPGGGKATKPRNGYHNPKAPGASIDHMFGSWSDYMSAIWSNSHGAEAVAARSEIIKLQNAFGSTVPADGGFLIPEILRSELLRVPMEQSLVRSRARVIPMESLTVPFPTIDATSNASSVHGGVVGYWTEEGAALTDSAPQFGRVVLQAKKLTLYSQIPNELFTDSLISLEAYMSQAYPEALAWFEDVAFISGGGVGEPTGFLNASAAVSVTKESGQTADTIVWENIVKMYSRMLPSSLGRAEWVCHIDTFPQLATMSLSVGTGGSAIWIGNGDGAGAPPMTILGRPVNFVEKVSTVGDAGDINFVDFGYYLVGDRQSASMETSVHSAFSSDKTAVRMIERVDGAPWIQSAITPQTGSNTLSPFVKIAARA